MSGWLVGRFEPGDLPWSEVEEFAAWLRTLGIDPTDVSVRAAVVRVKDGFELHLMRHVLSADDKALVNAAIDGIVMESVIVPVEENSWPDWLTGMGCGPKPATVEIRLDGSKVSDPILEVLRENVRRHTQHGDGEGPQPTGVS